MFRYLIATINHISGRISKRTTITHSLPCWPRRKVYWFGRLFWKNMRITGERYANISICSYLSAIWYVADWFLGGWGRACDWYPHANPISARYCEAEKNPTRTRATGRNRTGKSTVADQIGTNNEQKSYGKLLEGAAAIVSLDGSQMYAVAHVRW